MKHQKIANLLTVLLFVIPLALGLILFAALPDKDFSEEENRSLQAFPTLTWKSLSEGKFGQQMNEYFADQFPARDALVGIKGVAELAMGKGENNGVLLGKGSGKTKKQAEQAAARDALMLFGIDS